MQDLCDLVCRPFLLTSMVLRRMSSASKTCALVRRRALQVDVCSVKLQLLTSPSLAFSQHSGRAGPVGWELSVQPAARNMLLWLLAILFWQGLQGPLPQMASVRLRLPAIFSGTSWRGACPCLAWLLTELPLNQHLLFAKVPMVTAVS